MSHWAQINKNNIVINVLVGNNDESDEGYQFLIDSIGGRWIKTSFNTYGGIHSNGGIALRKNYAGIGFLYNEDLDAFIPPQPDSNPSFILNEETCLWVEPVAKPTDGKVYIWDEDSISWKEVGKPYESWVYDNGIWSAPVARPNDGLIYEWNENNQTWDILV